MRDKAILQKLNEILNELRSIREAMSTRLEKAKRACPNCGGELEEAYFIGERPRMVCKRCGWEEET